MSVMTERGLGLPAAEPQEVRPVTVSPHRPSVSVATVLERAALYIEEFGWIQGTWRTERGYCVSGAIIRADGDRCWSGPAHDAVRDALEARGQIPSVFQFNDLTACSARDATDLLREAARRVRDAGEATPSTPSTSSPRSLAGRIGRPRPQ